MCDATLYLLLQMMFYLWNLHCTTMHYPPGNHHASRSKNVLFPGHNHLLTTGADDLTF